MSGPRPELPGDIALRVRKARAAGNDDAAIEAKLRQKYGVGLDAVPFADVEGGASSPEFDYGVLNALAQGMSAGWSDELRAKEMEAQGEGSYDESLRRIREGQQRFKDKHPWVNGLTEFTGAVMSTVGAGKLIPILAGPIVGGATFGGAYGSGTAEEGHRLEGAATGAAVGALAGGVVKAVPVVATGLKGAKEGLVEAWKADKPLKRNAIRGATRAIKRMLMPAEPIVPAVAAEAAEAVGAQAPAAGGIAPAITEAAVPPMGGFMRPPGTVNRLGSPLDLMPPPQAAPALAEAAPVMPAAMPPVVQEAGEQAAPVVAKARLSPADRAARTAWLKGMTESELDVAVQKAIATGDESMQRSIMRELKRRVRTTKRPTPQPADEQDLEALLRASLTE